MDLLVEILIRNNHHQMSAWFEYAIPVKHGHSRIAHVLQAMRGMDKIVARICDTGENLRVTLRKIPGKQTAHARKEFTVQ